MGRSVTRQTAKGKNSTSMNSTAKMAPKTKGPRRSTNLVEEQSGEEMAYERLLIKVNENKRKRKPSEPLKHNVVKKGKAQEDVEVSFTQRSIETEDEVVLFEEGDNIMSMKVIRKQNQEFPSEEDDSEVEDGEIVGANNNANRFQ